MQYTCNKCLKTMDEVQFYTHKDGTKTDLCKKCLTMHIDSFQPDTFIWILEKMDVPYLPEEWNVLRDRAYEKNPKTNGQAIFGKYLSKMKLNQWKQYGFNDSEKILGQQTQKRKAIEENAMKHAEVLKEQLDRGEITEAQYKTMTSVESQVEIASNMGIMPSPMGHPNPFGSDVYFKEEELSNTLTEDLDEKDKLYLAMKWGRLYKPDEWVTLEKTYEEMKASFDIQDADTINTLILICKTDLKMNQAIDCGDVEGFQKLSKVSESLRKSAKFTAAQNKEKENNFVDAIGVLVAICERDGFIPRFATDIPQDKVDATLQDMNKYVHTLVTEDLGFGTQIENALKKLEIQQEQNATEESGQTELEDEDFNEFYTSIFEQQEEDAQLGEGV